LLHTFNAIELANTINGLSKLGAHPGEAFVEVGEGGREGGRERRREGGRGVMWSAIVHQTSVRKGGGREGGREGLVCCYFASHTS
jgi:hypothetical protein